MDDLSTKCGELLKSDGAVAIIIKQYLRPVEGKGEVIFQPTYPMPTYRGRVHTVRDGEYRVSVELPPFRYDSGKAEKKSEEEEQNVAGYNIDEFKDGSNVCEIDSPQSQANRLEPLFKTIKDGFLVPQITIKVGDQPVNLLDAGHRAADAVVRLSSLVDRFHQAFDQVRRGNHLELARLAPTSLLFGVWDSRGTQVKLPRLIKAEIRAENVQLCTRSAQFNPAIDFVRAGAVDEELDKGSGERNPLAAEGMKHVPAPRAAGGVRVLGDIKRVFRVNVVALRDLRAFTNGEFDKERTDQLQRYVLALALVAATHPFKLNLREGCLLCEDDERKASFKRVHASGKEDVFEVNPTDAETYAEQAARAFFGDEYERKNIADAKFEAGVANKFLAMTPDNRKKVARSGPITEQAIRKFEEMGRDPLKLVSEAIKEARKTLPPKPRGKNASPIVNPDSFRAVSERLDDLASDEQIDQTVKDLVGELKSLIQSDADTHSTFKALVERIKEFDKQRKAGENATAPAEPSDAQPA